MNYATFWQRFNALWIDFFVLLPVIVIRLWLESLSRTTAILLVLPMAALNVGYTIYCFIAGTVVITDSRHLDTKSTPPDTA